MTEIPMPGGDYQPSAGPPQKEQSFCGECCQNTCLAVVICFIVIIAIFFMIFAGFGLFDIF